MTVHHSHRDPPRAGKTGRSEEKQMEGDRGQGERGRGEGRRIFHCKRSHRAACGSGKERAVRGGGGGGSVEGTDGWTRRSRRR